MASASHSSAPGAETSDAAGPVRKRNVMMAGLDSSPGSVDDVEEGDAREERRRQPVKRACNECRQQKVRTPWTFAIRVVTFFLQYWCLLIHFFCASYGAM